MNKCCICGEKCSGKMKMNTRKGGKDNLFCRKCFGPYQMKDNKTVEKSIKDNKLLLKNYKFG